MEVAGGKVFFFISVKAIFLTCPEKVTYIWPLRICFSEAVPMPGGDSKQSASAESRGLNLHILERLIVYVTVQVRTILSEFQLLVVINLEAIAQFSGKESVWTQR